MRLKIALVLVLSVILLPFAATGAGGQVLAVDPLTKGTVVESEADIVSVWLLLGVKKATLLNISSDDGLGLLDPTALSRINKAALEGGLDIKREGARATRAKLFGEEDFLRAAWSLGLIGEVYWIAPFGSLKGPSGGAELAGYFRGRGFPEEAIASFKPVEGCWKGDAAGIPLTVCPREALPYIAGPVLVNIESSYFPYAASERKIRFVTEVKNFFTDAAAQGYEVTHVSLTPSTYSGKLGLNLRWLSDIALDILRNPGELTNPQTPARWTTLETGYGLLMGGKGRDVEEKMISHLSMLDKTDQAARLLLAQSLLLQNRFNEAYKLVIEACEADKAYCYGLVDTGLGMISGGAVDLGLVFFNRADEMAPELGYMEDVRGSALLSAGKWLEAAIFYGKLVERGGPWPNGLLKGYAELKLGDRGAALESFAKAVDALDTDTRYTSNPADLIEAVREAVSLLGEAGMGDKAKKLEGDARLGRYIGR